MQAETGAVTSTKQRTFAIALRRTVILAVAFFVPLYVAFRPAAIADPDIYWHAAAGNWIVQHHTVPRVDPFSTAHAPWVLYSWLFDLLAGASFSSAGLKGFLALTLGLTAMVTLATWLTIRWLRPDFLTSTALTAISLFAMSQLYTPRPWMFSICLFLLQMYLLLSFRADGQWRRLLWLPPAYVLLANIHVQFVHSLIVLGTAASVVTLEILTGGRVSSRFLRPRHSAKILWSMLLACFLATFVNPYGWRLYGDILIFARAAAGFEYIEELHSMSFRQPSHFAVVLLALYAAFKLGQSKSRDIFFVCLLAISSYFAFHSVRDLWLLVLTSAVIIAASPLSGLPEVQVLTVPRILLPLALAFAMLAIFPTPADMRGPLPQLQAAELPVEAVRFVRSRQLPGPMLNYFDWGGYLIQALPEIPVQIDGRGNVHTAAALARSANTWNLAPGWDTDPEFAHAKLILGRRDLPLSQHLVSDSRFQIVYQDELASVFVRR